MGLAATGSKEIAYEVAKATAEEIAACGLNLMMGPVLDVLTNVRNQPLGVRTTGDDPQEVSSYGIAFMKGYKDAGLSTMGKHFPSYGSLEFLGSALDVPTITESLESLSLNALVPFRNAIKEGLDAMMVGGCAMSSAGLNVMHACLSEQVVNDLLRKDLHFDGVVISDCLEMEALSHNIGVGGGTVMAINAGCDIVLLCRSFQHQQEAIAGFKLGVENAMITKERIRTSLKRVLDIKAKCTSWEKALNPPGIALLSKLQPSHTTLSTKAYNSSITVVRDKNRILPLTNIMEPEDELLLLTPLVKPLVASAASRALSEQATSGSPDHAGWERSASVMSGERVFRELGRSLARQRSGRVLHTSYTANGVRPQHENLINRASAIIIVTADANRNLYQHGFTKHVSMICNMQYTSGGDKREKPLVVVAVSSPYDFAMDQNIGTYICTYDFTETALVSLVKVLYGEFSPAGALPGTISQSQKLSQSRQHWLVEAFNEERDSHGLDMLVKTVGEGNTPGLRAEVASSTSNTFLLRNPEILESHFVVRNSSTQALYGFCATYFFKASGTGVIGAIFVDPSRRKLSIGHSLHNRAIRTLLQREGVKRFQLGSRLPSVYLGIPTGHGGERKRLRSWFANLGWNTALSRSICSMVARNLSTWVPPDGMAKSLQSAGVDFDLVYGWEYSGPVLDHIKTNNRQGLAEVYKLALADPSSCGVIRAKRPEDGALVGTVVLYNMQSQLAEFVPGLKEVGELAGGISSPVISPSVGEYSTLLQGLILLGVRQIKQQGCNACVLDYVSTSRFTLVPFTLPLRCTSLTNFQLQQMDGDGNFDGLSAMGFNVLHTFEEVGCDAATWTMVPPI
jgi:beta-N-acetylhexosaminidase